MTGTSEPSAFEGFSSRHLLGIQGLSPLEIDYLLNLADDYVELNRRADKKNDILRGRTQINLFFESSTRTQISVGIIKV